MKITREEFERSKKESAYDLFLQGIKSKETKIKYIRTIKKILAEILDEFFDGTIEQRCEQFVDLARKDPDYVQDLLLNLSKKLKERTIIPKENVDYLNPSTLPNYFKPIKKLLLMNNIAFSFSRIEATFPEVDNLLDTREWKRDEIHQMLKFSYGAIDRAIILIAASSGIRVGGFQFTWEDITPIYRLGEDLKIEITESELDQAEVVCAMIQIYRGSSQSYPAFITPEAYQAILDYKNEWTRETKREPRPEDPVFKREGSLPIMATTSAIKKRIERVLRAARLRTPLVKGKKRHEVPITNGFRRFWNKVCKESMSRDSPLASLIKKEFMMGHTGLVKLDRNYFKTHVLELAEEYLNAVLNLTISEEERTKADNRRLRKEKSELERKNEEILKMRDDIEKIKQWKENSESHQKKD